MSAIQLTYKMLLECLPELARRSKEFVSHVPDRGPFPPEFIKCTLNRPETRSGNVIGYITLYIKELNPMREQLASLREQPPTLSLTYAITRDGKSTYTREVAFINMGSETIYNTPIGEWLAWIPDNESRKRIQGRAATIHEELVATVWRPERVQAMLETGGWDLVEAL